MEPTILDGYLFEPLSREWPAGGQFISAQEFALLHKMAADRLQLPSKHEGDRHREIGRARRTGLAASEARGRARGVRV